MFQHSISTVLLPFPLSVLLDLPKKIKKRTIINIKVKLFHKQNQIYLMISYCCDNNNYFSFILTAFNLRSIAVISAVLSTVTFLVYKTLISFKLAFVLHVGHLLAPLSFSV